MNIDTFFENCIIHAPAPPEWFEHAERPQPELVPMPDKQEWWSKMNDKNKNVVMGFFQETIPSLGGRHPAFRLGDKMIAEGLLPVEKKLELLGVDKQINEYQDLFMSIFTKNLRRMQQYESEKYFVWKRYYACTMVEANFPPDTVDVFYSKEKQCKASVYCPTVYIESANMPGKVGIPAVYAVNGNMEGSNLMLVS